ncbi:MAG: DEAD/DEAH box helicase [Thermoanaerobaculales bacterium]|nr:DEAD/DEAH box helicase [Thermoanaerobaculales bacterium]
MHDTPFAEVPEGLGAVLADRGFTELTPIQTAVLNPDLAGRDLRISSQTGSGKTVALGLLVAHEVAAAVTLENRGPVRARPSVLLVAPTRELAVQLAEELSWLFRPLGATVVSLTGGTSLGIDFRELKRDPQVLVGTPGRVRDHLERGSLQLDRVCVVALDEADEMLAMGFEEEVSAILEATPEERRTHLMSATFPRSVQSVAARHQRNSVMVAGTTPGKSNSDIAFHTMVVPPNQRLSALVNILLMEPEAKTLVFVRTRIDTAGLSDALADLGFATRPLSGDLNQRERTATLNAFRRGQTPILVATDVAARGLDVQDIAQVIHVDPTDNVEMLTHRSGRTGRAGRKGRSLIFVPPRAFRRVDAMLRHAGIKALQTNIPSRDDIDRAADRRLLERFSELGASDHNDVDRLHRVAAELLEGRDPVAVVATLLGEADHGGPCAPRDIKPVSIQDGRDSRHNHPRGRRPSSGNWARFQVSWGKHHGADPRRLLAIVCRRGGISSSDVGDITIGGNSSMVEINPKLARAFTRSTGRPDPRDPRIKFREWRDQKSK